MKEQDPLWTFLYGVGASIIGGAVAGYVLIKNPGMETYLILLIAGALIAVAGLWKSGAGKR